MEPSPESASTRPAASVIRDRPVTGAGPQVPLDATRPNAAIAAVQRDRAGQIVGANRSVTGASIGGQLPGRRDDQAHRRRLPGPDVNPVASIAGSGRLDDDSIAVLSGVDDQRLRGLLDPARAVRSRRAPRCDPMTSSESSRRRSEDSDPALAADREPFLLPSHDPLRRAHRCCRRQIPRDSVEIPSTASTGVSLRMSSSQRP